MLGEGTGLFRGVLRQNLILIFSYRKDARWSIFMQQGLGVKVDISHNIFLLWVEMFVIHIGWGEGWVVSHTPST